MSGRLARTLCTAALAAVVAASPAFAEPAGPGPVPAGGPDPAPAAGAPQQNVAGLLTQLQTLYRKAEEAGELYKGTEEQLKKRTAEARKLRAELARARTALDSGRRDAGRLARDQYQGRTDFSVYLRLLLAEDPARALEQSHVIERAQAGRSAAVDRLTGAERHAEKLAATSRAAQERQRALAAQRKKQRDTVETRLKGIEAMLASLSADQLAAVSALERKNIGEAQDALTASGALSSARPPSEEGGEAVRFAVEQIGKPYVWGAEGPESFDCSGLTSQAWSDAGRTIPRTSQEQWRQLPRVPVGSLRPGDLVVYFPKATHVALYIGNGLVVQAPRPGASVKVSPLASNPLLGAVRPDPDSEPLSTYTPPELPEDAASGPDARYDAPDA
ncbi:NlpC/P60 family protein [Streptomyces sp. NPDC060322]|uniref:C40 family peptidase n=1 Tax=Streptomyces sp. NPDC060322 TaxID=3347097 RepID=UPI003666CAB1